MALGYHQNPLLDPWATRRIRPSWVGIASVGLASNLISYVGNTTVLGYRATLTLGTLYSYGKLGFSLGKLYLSSSCVGGKEYRSGGAQLPVAACTYRQSSWYLGHQSPSFQIYDTRSGKPWIIHLVLATFSVTVPRWCLTSDRVWPESRPCKLPPLDVVAHQSYLAVYTLVLARIAYLIVID